MNMSIRVINPHDPLFAEVRCLRSRYLGTNPAQETDFELREPVRDALSYHLIYLDGAQVVGALRITPVGHGLSFVERAIDIHKHFKQPMDTFDANRLVLNERYRGGRHLRNFLLGASVWLKANTHLRFISALCSDTLQALYVGIGGRVVAENITWQGQVDQRLYSLICLELDNVYRNIKGIN
ncbi:MAG: acetyltransferase [Pseudomonas sp.]|uniref:acetyltransferase n=1 Tax=Pseudomonas sp. TaxID=306 RepID=UPI003D6FD22A